MALAHWIHLPSLVRPTKYCAVGEPPGGLESWPGFRSICHCSHIQS